jgi:hypothetical protein
MPLSLADLFAYHADEAVRTVLTLKDQKDRDRRLRLAEMQAALRPRGVLFAQTQEETTRKALAMAAIAASPISTPGTLELPGSSRWDTTTARRDFRASSSRGSRPRRSCGRWPCGQWRPRPCPATAGSRLSTAGDRERDQALDVTDSAARGQCHTSTRKKNNPGKELEARMQQVPTDTKRRMPSSPAFTAMRSAGAEALTLFRRPSSIETPKILRPLPSRQSCRQYANGATWRRRVAYLATA